MRNNRLSLGLILGLIQACLVFPSLASAGPPPLAVQFPDGFSALMYFREAMDHSEKFAAMDQMDPGKRSHGQGLRHIEASRVSLLWIPLYVNLEGTPTFRWPTGQTINIGLIDGQTVRPTEIMVMDEGDQMKYYLLGANAFSIASKQLRSARVNGVPFHATALYLGIPRSITVRQSGREGMIQPEHIARMTVGTSTTTSVNTGQSERR